MSEPPEAWYHCTRCDALFKAAGSPETRGACPACAGDPAGYEETEAPAMVRVRRKVRKPRSGKQKKPARSRQGKRKARALMIFVIAWVFVLGLAAITMKRKGPDRADSTAAQDSSAFDPLAKEDQRILKDNIEACANRLQQFLAATDVGSQSAHVLRPERTLPRMIRFQQFNPVYASTSQLVADFYQVIHTPAGRAIESVWNQEGDKQVEAVFFETEGEWKIDWDAFVRAGTEPWALFLAGSGEGEGEFRVLARERIGANGRDPEYIGLVLYSPRPGHPGEATSPSPEIRVTRSSPMGRLIEESFEARKAGIGPYGSKVVTYDPGEMIRLRVNVTREGEDEREFQIVEILANHWMELPPAAE